MKNPLLDALESLGRTEDSFTTKDTKVHEGKRFRAIAADF